MLFSHSLDYVKFSSAVLFNQKCLSELPRDLFIFSQNIHALMHDNPGEWDTGVHVLTKLHKWFLGEPLRIQAGWKRVQNKGCVLFLYYTPEHHGNVISHSLKMSLLILLTIPREIFLADKA